MTAPAGGPARSLHAGQTHFVVTLTPSTAPAQTLGAWYTFLSRAMDTLGCGLTHAHSCVQHLCMYIHTISRKNFAAFKTNIWS